VVRARWRPRAALLSTARSKGYLKAVRISDGKELWKFKTPSGIIGNVFTYVYQGKQFVGVYSGIGGWAGIGMAAGLEKSTEGWARSVVIANLRSTRRLAARCLCLPIRADRAWQQLFQSSRELKTRTGRPRFTEAAGRVRDPPPIVPTRAGTSDAWRSTLTLKERRAMERPNTLAAGDSPADVTGFICPDRSGADEAVAYQVVDGTRLINNTLQRLADLAST